MLSAVLSLHLSPSVKGGDACHPSLRDRRWRGVVGRHLDRKPVGPRTWASYSSAMSRPREAWPLGKSRFYQNQTQSLASWAQPRPSSSLGLSGCRSAGPAEPRKGLGGLSGTKGGERPDRPHQEPLGGAPSRRGTGTSVTGGHGSPRTERAVVTVPGSVEGVLAKEQGLSLPSHPLRAPGPGKGAGVCVPGGPGVLRFAELSQWFLQV